MFDFRKSKSYTKLSENEDRFVSTESMAKNHQIMTRILTSDKSIVVSLVGPNGSGKHSFLASALRKEEMDEQKITTLHSQEIIKNGDIDVKLLIKVIRSTMAVQIKEQQKIIEGEVISITTDKIHLKTMDMESVFDVGIRMGRELERARVCVGDVIKIFKENCFITRVGRASSHNASFRADLLPIVSLPEGECIKNENVSTLLTLDELDIINYKEDGEKYLYSNQITNEYIQSEVDKKISKWIKEGKAILNRGVLIIEKGENLSPEHLKKIEVVMNGLFAPTLVLIYNQITGVRMNNGIQLKFVEYTETELLEIIKMASGSIEDSTTEFLQNLAKEKGIKKTFKVIESVQKPFTISSLKRVTEMFEL